jgi:hypothetical protein
MRKVLSLDGIDYTLSTITNEVAKSFGDFKSEDGTMYKGREFNTAIITASLKAGGHSDASELISALPYFIADTFVALRDAAYEVNGFKPVKTGEEAPGETPAEAVSTGSSSTDA